jgi:hypothetical protein
LSDKITTAVYRPPQHKFRFYKADRRETSAGKLEIILKQKGIDVCRIGHQQVKCGVAQNGNNLID